MRRDDRQIIAIIPAGGFSRRMGGEKGKLLLPLRGEPVFSIMLQALNIPEIEAFFIPVTERDKDEISRIVFSGKFWRENDLAAKVTFCTGGLTRQESVYSGLLAAEEWDGWRVPVEKRIVVIHDAARPLVEPEYIYKTIKAAMDFGAAVLGVPVKDTIKVVEDGYIQKTLPRNTLWSIQTPQAFTWSVIRAAHEGAKETGFTGTDDASLVEQMGKPVRLVEGSYKNIKITTPEDLHLAEALYVKEDREPGMAASVVDRYEEMRVGQGFDVHRLVKGRPLILGNVEIPYEFGLDGHSDADVAIHALIDALLGAAGLGDIGELFPDTDRQYKNIDSGILLKEVLQLLRRKKISVVNIDLTIIAQRPKLAVYRRQIREKLAGLLGIEKEDVSVKATSTEGLGFAGRGEGIAAQVVALVKKISDRPCCTKSDML
ncbi:MAG TPA: 2-C-methyl-D-erythritol 2,4-cyclodiphosphate synthase [Firmicutes bacterium]|nr:2-C-methyl-D-erythritol 2,4-cyclodiphosphate synthase [Bacillota bacterium]